MNEILKLDNVTKDFGKGIFIKNINISIKKGEVFGFVGPSGSGKTTTIRTILGFIRPDSGKSEVMGFESWKQSNKVQGNIGYVAGEIVFPENMTGKQFLIMSAELKKVENYKEKIEQMAKFWQLDIERKIKKMSKGMKQRVALINCFMEDSNVIVLDEPTSGLDPLMQNKFNELIIAEKEKGKTIFLSSHIFLEVEKVCDNVAIIKNGVIIKTVNLKELFNLKDKKFTLEFSETQNLQLFLTNFKDIEVIKVDQKILELKVKNENLQQFLQEVSKYKLKNFEQIKVNLEDFFMKFYREESE